MMIGAPGDKGDRETGWGLALRRTIQGLDRRGFLSS